MVFVTMAKSFVTCQSCFQCDGRGTYKTKKKHPVLEAQPRHRVASPYANGDGENHERRENDTREKCHVGLALLRISSAVGRGRGSRRGGDWCRQCHPEVFSCESPFFVVVFLGYVQASRSEQFGRDSATLAMSE